MSIPPLVCSTPPPPDQCEDDKDPEDFDLPYNLSQDDDENYDYGSFSTYNHFQSATEIKKPVVIMDTIAKIIENEKLDESQPENKNGIDLELGSNSIESKLKLEDEVIEDLDLKVDEEVLGNTDVVVSESCIEFEGHDAPKSEEIVGKVDTPNISNIDQEHLTPSELPPDDILTELPSLEQIDEPPCYIDEIAAETVNLKYTDGLSLTEDLQKLRQEPVDVMEPVVKDTLKNPLSTDNVSQDNDDDFGDFDDFQFASVSDKTTIVIDSCENPWGSSEPADNDFGNFGDFKASFDNSEANINESMPNDDAVITESDVHTIVEHIPENDDDFGDFNDFNTSALDDPSVETELRDDDESSTPPPLLTLQSLENESEFQERVNSLINNIFYEEMPEHEEVFEGRLETQLSVTWGHLLEVDVRQPYMVNWNNSLAQKTLLKALCIDSRNILFGPKWSSNMPKYAATLSAAPLQPQKQAALPSTSQGEAVAVMPEKTASKSANTWSDPFTSDGQEFTYAETLLLDLEHLMATLDQMAHNHSNFKISELLSHACNKEAARETTIAEPRPTDLDVFEAPMTKKADKIYSSTLSVQPIRQINLPDTHIFTPTDSETPRSKTIHYDNPTVLLPQTSISNKTPIETLSPQPGTSSLTNADSDDYWEFQDFRGPSTSASNISHSISKKTENESSKPTYGTQLLQPIKMEPIMPSLNWPDPGQVKETFDDFSEFIPSSTLSTSNQKQEETYNQPDIKALTTQSQPTNTVTSTEVTTDNRPVVDTIDDDFDTFQSAPPTSSQYLNFSSMSHHQLSSTANIPPQTAQQNIPDFEFAFPKVESANSKLSNIKTKGNIVQNQMSFTPPQLNSITKTTDLNSKIAPPLQANNQIANTSVLQPIPSSSSNAMLHNHQKGGQILQPLSLESISQINWPNPGIDLQDLSRFNPMDTVHTLSSEFSTNSHSKSSSPVHSQKSSHNSQVMDDDWGEFVSSAPKQQLPAPKKQPTFVDEDEWTDFISSPSVKPQNGLNTISLNVHTNIQKSVNATKFTKNQLSLDIPTLSIITPKSSNNKKINDNHFENL